MSYHSDYRGFSLVEITIALAVIAFALVGIMGLFPVAMRSATESQRETRATFIAQSLYSDLKSGITPTNTFIGTSSNFVSSSGRQTVNLSANGTYCVFFTEDGAALGGANLSAFESANPASAYGAKVIVTPQSALTNLSSVEVQVEAPTSAASSNRTKYNFVTYLRNR